MSLPDYAVLSFSSLFAIVDPIALVPSFLAMTERHSVEDKVRISWLASLVTFFVLVLFAWTGQWIFRIFGITLAAFEIAGGVVLLIISLDMLNARQTTMKETPEEQAAGRTKEDIAVTPLAVPMLAGPGAITAVTLLASRADSFPFQATLLLNIFLVSGASFFILRMAAVRSQWISVIALKITMRLMGLLLAAIAVQFILNGLEKSAIRL